VKVESAAGRQHAQSHLDRQPAQGGYRRGLNSPGPTTLPAKAADQRTSADGLISLAQSEKRNRPN